MWGLLTKFEFKKKKKNLQGLTLIDPKQKKIIRKVDIPKIESLTYPTIQLQDLLPGLYLFFILIRCGDSPNF
jgi:hypothetical protein